MPETILLIAPHPDDEILGAGGTLLLHQQMGDKIHVVYVTERKVPDWNATDVELHCKCRDRVLDSLGLSSYISLGFPDSRLDTIPQRELNDALSVAIKNIKPTIVYIPHRGDLNLDHRLVFQSALVATRTKVFPVRKILSYEVLSSTEKGRKVCCFDPNVFIDITSTIDRKLNLLEMYEGEMNNCDPDRTSENIRTLARFRGIEGGFDYAEAFCLIRETITGV